jgi:hypothetical protein
MELEPDEKLLFLYFLTNPNTNIAGVYEINFRTVEFETGIAKKQAQKMLDKFCNDEKMWFKDGWLVLRNFVKHQRLNPSVKQGIERQIGQLPQWLQKELHDLRNSGQLQMDLPVDKQSENSLSPESPQDALPNLTKPNLTKPNLTAPSREGPKNLDKKNYAKAVRADEALAERERDAGQRPKPPPNESTVSAADAVRARLKAKHVKGF